MNTLPFEFNDLFIDAWTSEWTGRSFGEYARSHPHLNDYGSHDLSTSWRAAKKAIREQFDIVDGDIYRGAVVLNHKESSRFFRLNVDGFYAHHDAKFSIEEVREATQTVFVYVAV